jgi:hypothetical protein
VRISIYRWLLWPFTDKIVNDFLIILDFWDILSYFIGVSVQLIMCSPSIFGVFNFYSDVLDDLYHSISLTY